MTFSELLYTIVGIFIGASAYHFLSKDRTDRDSFNQAAKELRDTFLTELKGLYPDPSEWPPRIDVFLKSKFTALQAAVAKFKPFLPKRQQQPFEDAWRKYYGWTGREVDIGLQTYYDYFPTRGTYVLNDEEGSYDNTETYQSNFKANVDKILSFAEPK